MALAKLPSKEDCLAVELPLEPSDKYEKVVSRVFTWPDPIGYTVDRDTNTQGIALIEFPDDYAVVWLERKHYPQQREVEMREAAERVLREWARL
jgi:hypothetical protein